jgi:hypothetical protein
MGVAKTPAEHSMTTFAALNGGRAVTYFSQTTRVYRDPNGATAVSLVTWWLFAAANVASVWYALTVTNDPIMAIVSSLNAIGCLAIAGLTTLKRASAAHLGTSSSHWIESLRQSCSLKARAPSTLSSRLERDDSPRERHRDELILQGLMS